MSDVCLFYGAKIILFVTAFSIYMSMHVCVETKNSLFCGHLIGYDRLKLTVMVVGYEVVKKKIPTCVANNQGHFLTPLSIPP